MTDTENTTGLPALPCYEQLTVAEDEDFTWPEFDERTAGSLCYTSGTAGHPKGALYSHRSTVLHTFGISLPDAISISAADVFCPDRVSMGPASTSCSRPKASLMP
jgi:3-(methylthio)propionyl---CoA ligase